MTYTHPFSALTRNDAPIAGGKGASLGEMLNAGIPVPDGFVVLSTTFDHFIKETDLETEITAILEQVDHTAIHTVDEASEKIQELISTAAMPEAIATEIKSEFAKMDSPFVAVRSSATAEDGAEHAWAGQLESYLNTDESTLLLNVQKCWASLFTPRAIFYRFEKGLHETHISVAVVVQKMVASEISGIAFSVHPVTEDYNQLIIEAGFGLGEAIVSGSVTPDSYVVQKEPRLIIDINVSTQTRQLIRAAAGGNEWVDIPEPKASSQVLTEAQVLELGALIIHIEKHYGFPCDIEWAYENGKFYIVQCRPITTLTQRPPDSQHTAEPSHTDDSFFKISRSEASTLSENDLIEKAGVSLKGLETMRQEGSFSLLIYGGCFPGCLEPYTIPYHQEAKLHCALLFVTEGHGLTIFSWQDYISFTQEAFKKFAADNGKLLNLDDFHKTWEKIKDWYHAYDPKTITEMSVEAATAILIEIFDEYHRFLAETVFCESLDETQIKSMHETAGGAKDDFAKFLEMSSKATFDSFVLRQDEALATTKDPYDMQWIFTNYFLTQTLEETPEKYKAYIKEKGSLENIKKEIENIRKEISESIKEVKAYRESLDEKLHPLFDFIQSCMYLRDIRKEALQKNITLLSNFSRSIFEKLGLVSGDAAYGYCDDFRTNRHLKSDYKEEIARRKEGVTVYFSNEEVTFEYGDVAEKTKIALDRFDKISTDKEFKGTTAYPGIVTGPVKVMHSEKDFPRFNDGDILVTSMTRPEFVPLMKRAAAVITDEGGVTCHAAIIARELKLPCIIGTRNATRILHDGDVVEVDADKGVVKLISGVGINTGEYQHFGMWECNPFAEYFWVSWFNKMYLDKLGINISESGVLVLNGGHFFVKKSVIKQVAQFIHSKIDSNEIGFFDSFVNFANNLYQKSLDRSRQSLSVQNDSDFIAEVASIGKDIMFAWFLGWLFCEVFESQLQNVAKKNEIPSEKISEYIPLISTPLMEQQKELRSLKQALVEKGVWEDLKVSPRKAIDSIEQDSDLSKRFAEHLKKYAWIQILNFLGEDITIENLLDQMTHLNDQKKQHEKPIVLSSFEYYATVSSRLSYLRQTGAEYFSIYTQIILQRLKEIASSLKLSPREILEFLPSEINKFLDGKISPDEHLAKRKNNNWCLYADTKSNLQILDDKEQIDILIQKMIPSFDQNQDVIKGQVGNKGFATGKVKVILANTQFDKMEVGDVLVTTMTTPDFVILMQKATAIITDIGGLLCHAAIVSREINKPCVIGTKNATQILKDGDMVEVDADKGIIKILNSNDSQSGLVDIGNLSWRKNWAGTWTILECCEFGYEYTDHLKNCYGVGLEKVLFAFENGSSSNYIATTYNDAFSEKIAEIIQQDPKKAFTWAKQITEKTDTVLNFLSNQSSIIAQSDYDQLWKLLDEYLQLNFPMKKIVDYLTPETLKEVLPILEKARVYGEPVYAESSKFVRKYIGQIAKHENREAELLLCMTSTELRSYLENGALPSDEELKERFNCSVLAVSGRSVEIAAGETAKKLLAQITSVKASDTLQGKSAYGGLVRGTVRVVMKPEEVSGLPENTILVTGMTRPEYLHLFKEATGVITDAGGVLSHAAITARELKKPTVIGTEVATKVLKDGDVVEIDADKGIVKIINTTQKADSSNTVNFDSHDWKLIVTRNMSLWHQYLGSKAYYHKNSDYGIESNLESLAVSLDATNTTIFYYDPNFSSYIDSLMRIAGSRKKLKTLKKTCQVKAAALKKKLAACLKNINEKTFEDFAEAYCELCPSLQGTNTMGRAGTVKLEKMLADKGYDEGRVSEVIGLITYPTPHTPLFDSQEGMYKIGDKVQHKKLAGKKLDAELERWLKSYGHIPVNFCEESWSLDDAKKQLAQVLEKNCAETLAAMAADHKNRLKERDALLKSIKDPEIETLALALQDATYLNEYRKNVFSYVSLNYRPIFQYIVSLGGSDNWRDGFYLTPVEMSDLLRGRKIDVSAVVASRKTAGFYVDGAGKQHELLKEKVATFVDFIKHSQGSSAAPVAQQSNSIKGFSANKGKITGTARLILSSKDFDKLQRGEILVTTMTSVDFVPVMERAGAFVTNEGGITSHAAIVAREMKKPCVIGTKIATQVIKDGDMVEVDADKGIVNIIR